MSGDRIRTTSGMAEMVYIVNGLTATISGGSMTITGPLPEGEEFIGYVGVSSMPVGASSATVQGTVAHDSPAANNPVLLGAYASDTTPTSVAAADVSRLWAKLNGALSVFNAYALNSTDDAVQAFPPSTAQTSASAAYENDRVIKAGAGTLVSLSVYNSKASAQFIQIHNVTSTPADGVAPIFVVTVPTVANYTINFPLSGLPCTTGIYVCNSSTGPTKTLGSDDCYFTAVYL